MDEIVSCSATSGEMPMETLVSTVPPESICTLARVNRKGRTREGPRGSRDETVRFTRRNRAVHETKPRLNISRGQKDEAQTQ